jgi:hypothetical protein
MLAVKRLTPLLLLLSGCIVQSINPFAPDNVQVAVPELTGEWTLVTKQGDDVDGKNIKPWVFSKEKIVAFDENNVPSPLEVHYFRVGNTLLCQSTIGDPDEAKIGVYWAIHTIPAFTLCKVEVKGDEAHFLPLDYKVLMQNINDGKVILPNVDYQNAVLFTATTAQWTALLKQYAAKPETFNQEDAFVFKRVVPRQSSKPPAPDSPPR